MFSWQQQTLSQCGRDHFFSFGVYYCVCMHVRCLAISSYSLYGFVKKEKEKEALIESHK